MNKFILLITVLFWSVVLTACGGGGTNTASVAPTNPTNPTPIIKGKIVIDNGRGTSNNQDTEAPK